ncbi:protein kinase domain-containing protein [Lentzea sp. NPDC055074]
MTEETFGPYRIEELLGRGGMGEVHRAYDTAHDRFVALKRLSPGYHDDEDYRARFRREAQIVARLREPHVIPIHAYGEIEGRLYLDMRLVEGADLSDVIREGTIEPSRAVTIVDQVASALDAAHADGLVHRDVKPSNVLVTSGDFVYLVDFGIARSVSPAATSLTASGSVVGTLDYMAPERFESGPVDGRADVYALACVLFACLAGRRPFTADGTAAQIWAHMKEEPPKASPLNPAVPAALDAVIAKGMAKDPADRYATAGALARAAAQALAAPVTPPATSPTTPLGGAVAPAAHPATPPGGVASPAAHPGAQSGGGQAAAPPGTPPGGNQAVAHPGTPPGGNQAVAHPGTPPGGQAAAHPGTPPGGQAAAHLGTPPGGQAAARFGPPTPPGGQFPPTAPPGQTHNGPLPPGTPAGSRPRPASAQFPQQRPQQAFHPATGPHQYPPTRVQSPSPAKRIALAAGVVALVAGIVATILIIGNGEKTQGSGTTAGTTPSSTTTTTSTSASKVTTTTRSPEYDKLVGALPAVFRTGPPCAPAAPDNGVVAAVRCTGAKPDGLGFPPPAEAEFRLFADRAAQDAFFKTLVTSRGIPRMDERGGCRPKSDPIHYALYYRDVSGPLDGEFTTCFLDGGNAQVWWVDTKTLTIGALKKPGDVDVLDKLDLWWNHQILSAF